MVFCNNCQSEIDDSKYFLHEGFCKKNIKYCFQCKEKIPIEELKKSTELIDKITMQYGTTGRVLVRYSGTEPKCRVMLEGPDPEQIRRDAQAIADLIAIETKR